MTSTQPGVHPAELHRVPRRVEELPSGNILIGAGGQRMQGAPAQILEVDPSANNEVVWQVDYDDTFFYRARRATSLAGETVTAG